ncbi:CBS domain-containing protein [Candidatus Woesearchaeota archaeon]|nr:MAG: CBS domain-containing protein [Candidatus Woesearchaeota archaeon]
MSKPVITISEYNSAFEAAKAMARNGIGSLVIAHNNTPVGIITERDLVYKVTAKGLDPKRVFIHEIMTKNVKTIDIHTSFLEVSKLMHKHTFRRLVVLDSGQIVGIITAKDLIELVSV